MTNELLDGQVYRLNLGIVNAYLVDDGEVTLVDAGTPGALETLRDELAGAGYDTTDLDRVLVTHFDLDHVGGLAGLEIDAPIYAMEPDASFIGGTAKPPLTKQKGLFQRLMGLRFRPPGGAIERVTDGDTVGGFTAHHTPGHTPGHVAYHHDSLSVALLGDLVRETNGQLETPPWFINYRTGENAASVRALADLDLAFEIAAMGHGEPLLNDGADALQALARRLE